MLNGAGKRIKIVIIQDITAKENEINDDIVLVILYTYVQIFLSAVCFLDSWWLFSWILFRKEFWMVLITNYIFEIAFPLILVMFYHVKLTLQIMTYQKLFTNFIYNIASLQSCKLLSNIIRNCFLFFPKPFTKTII